MIVMDFVCIEGLRVEAVIGAYAWERELRQPLLIGARLGYDNRAVGTLAAAIDYATVAHDAIVPLGPVRAKPGIAFARQAR